LVTAVSNHGTLGTGLSAGPISDCFTGQYLRSGEYPAGSGASYLFGGAIWIGAVVGEDTLVSTAYDGYMLGTARELHPTANEHRTFEYRSICDPTSEAFPGALAEQEYHAVYLDTCTDCQGVGPDAVDGRPHIPLGISVEQSSYAWSYGVTEDFVLLNYRVENIGGAFLHDVYFGVYVDHDIYDVTVDPSGYTDDLSGFLSIAPDPDAPSGSQRDLDLKLAWSADDDGFFQTAGYPPRVPAVISLAPLEELPDSIAVSFNWWNRATWFATDYGPQHRENFRLMGDGGTGPPKGDRDKYHLLSNGEVDFDQYRTASLSANDPVWLPPPFDASVLATGCDTRYLLSIGPFNLSPGEGVNVPLAMIMGDSLHTKRGDAGYLPGDPDGYRDQLDFGDLVRNLITARKVYDNPGVDTDGDGIAGYFDVCGDDTVWYRGDGIPDWTAVRPPAAPAVRVDAEPDGLRVRWNGWSSERSVRALTGEESFEGYNVYIALENTLGSFANVGSYDIEDYRCFVWDTVVSDWNLSDSRLRPEEAACRFAPLGCDDPVWHPADYPRAKPFVSLSHPDSVLYFEPVGPNRSMLGWETPIVKSYPDAGRPPYSSPDQVPPDSADFYLTASGTFKFYEYHVVVTNLLPEQEYYVSVTAFDYGSRVLDAAPLESDRLTNSVAFTPLLAGDICCEGVVGNVNGDPNEIVNIADVALLVDYLFLSGGPISCPAEADLDRSGGVAPDQTSLSLADLILLVDHMFISKAPLPECL
jgi:hypothetical protein